MMIRSLRTQYADLMTNIVVVQFSEMVQTSRDKRYNLTCLFGGPGEAVVTSGYIGAGSVFILLHYVQFYGFDLFFLQFGKSDTDRIPTGPEYSRLACSSIDYVPG